MPPSDQRLAPSGVGVSVLVLEIYLVNVRVLMPVFSVGMLMFEVLVLMTDMGMRVPDGGMHVIVIMHRIVLMVFAHRLGPFASDP
jgi:hypothetical protein